MSNGSWKCTLQGLVRSDTLIILIPSQHGPGPICGDTRGRRARAASTVLLAENPGLLYCSLFSMSTHACWVVVFVKVLWSRHIKAYPCQPLVCDSLVSRCNWQSSP